MGYRRSPIIYRLQFADPEYEGLEVEARSIPLGKVVELFKLSRLADVDTRALSEDDIKNMSALFDTFADALVRWNLEEPEDPANEDGPWRPVPANLLGVLSQDMGFMTRIVMTWLETVASVPGDLGKGLNSGPHYPEQSAQTAPKSLNLENLMKQN